MAAVVENHFNFIRTFDHVVVGEDVAAGADDDATAQAALGFVALLAIEELEPRVVGVGVFAGGLAGADADHGSRGLLRRQPKAACGHFTRSTRGLKQGDRARCGRATVQPLRLERGHDKVGRQQHGGGLGEEKPKTFHSGKL
ncbi:MAG: hypothetical protein RL302_963 [Pseudomonadota bacterium]